MLMDGVEVGEDEDPTTRDDDPWCLLMIHAVPLKVEEPMSEQDFKVLGRDDKPWRC